MADHESIIEGEFALMPVWKIIPDPRSFRRRKIYLREVIMGITSSEQCRSHSTATTQGVTLGKWRVSCDQDIKHMCYGLNLKWHNRLICLKPLVTHCCGMFLNFWDARYEWWANSIGGGCWWSASCLLRLCD